MSFLRQAAFGSSALRSVFGAALSSSSPWFAAAAGQTASGAAAATLSGRVGEVGLPAGVRASSSSGVYADAGYVTLNALAPAPGSRATKRRVGRGIGCSKGKTCGRGHKGQKSRVGTGKPRKLFEGGQTPLSERFPKRGFKNVNATHYHPINICDIAALVESGKLDASEPITMRALWEAKAVDKKLYNYDGVKLLARGAGAVELPKGLTVEVSQVSEKARDAIEAAGGSVKKVYYNKLGLRAHLRPEWFVEKGRLVPRQVRQLPLRNGDKFDVLGAIDPDPRRDGPEVAAQLPAKLKAALDAHAASVEAAAARKARRATFKATVQAKIKSRASA